MGENRQSGRKVLKVGIEADEEGGLGLSCSIHRILGSTVVYTVLPTVYLDIRISRPYII
jgi:hypothetical protein